VFTGLVIIWMGQFFLGIAIVILAAFFLTSFSGIEIDTDKREIKPYNQLFGIIRTGSWKKTDAYIGLTLVPMKRVSTIASRANLTTSTVHKDYRIYLVNKAKKPAIPIKICKTREQAQNSIDELSIWLRLPVYSIKR
jgi:hypothetical protein